ncbi:MAG: metal-binding protein [Deinococcales bacterium]
MPSGNVHNLVNTIAYVGFAGAYGYAHSAQWAQLEPTTLLCFSGAFMAGTFMLSPDLDLAEQNVSSKKNWGILGFLWVPYGLMFSHRGLSHTWIVGPLTRVLYLGLLLALPIWLLRRPILETELEGVTRGLVHDLLNSLQHVFSSGVLASQAGLGAVVGYYVSQWLHLIADGVAPDVRLNAKKRRTRR